jgi:hypothetical protein
VLDFQQLRLFDQAKRIRHNANVQWQYAVTPKLGLSGTFSYLRDNLCHERRPGTPLRNIMRAITLGLSAERDCEAFPLNCNRFFLLLILISG